jgi:excisionase family DNA binding protein
MNKCILFDGKEYMTVNDAAKTLGIAGKTIYSMVYAGKLHYVEVLGHKAVNVSDVKSLMRFPERAKAS